MRRLAVLGVALFLSGGLSLGTGIAAAAATGPQVNGIDPNSGSTAGGTNVAIFGSGFTGATSVKFGANPVRQFFVADDHRIFTNSPPGAAGPVDVTVTTPAGASIV